MTLTLRAVRAKHGDSLLLIAGGATVLIDGGPAGVYRQFLRHELLALRSDRDRPARIDLVVVSHIDADHIAGVLDLTDELIDARENMRTPFVELREAWHNSFSDMVASGDLSSGAVQAAAASVASAFGELSRPAFDPREARLVLSGVAQGRRLRLDLRLLSIPQNTGFQGGTVLRDAADDVWEMGGLRLEVVGPTGAQLDDLREVWRKHLDKVLSGDRASVASATEMDRSVSNLASIVILAAVENKKVLFTGDARGDMILSWLEEAGHLSPGETIRVDIMKVPHHGSDRNVTPEFFERVRADHYVVSGNGGHGNPEPATLKMLFEARPSLDYQIHMTYGPEELKAHKKFIEEGNVEKLDDVLSDPRRAAMLRFPDAGETHLDVTV